MTQPPRLELVLAKPEVTGGIGLVVPWALEPLVFERPESLDELVLELRSGLAAVEPQLSGCGNNSESSRDGGDVSKHEPDVAASEASFTRHGLGYPTLGMGNGSLARSDACARNSA